MTVIFFLWQCLLSIWITETLWLMWELGTDREFVRAVIHEDRHGRVRGVPKRFP